MKKYIILTSALFLGVFTIQAQEKTCNIKFINIESGINLSQFSFSDAEVTAFQNGSFSPSQYQAAFMGYRLNGDLDIILGAAYNKHKIMGESIGMNDSHLSYDLNYISANVALEYVFLLEDKLSLLFSGGMAYNYLISGFQNIGSATNDLVESNFEDNTYSYKIGTGLLYQVTDIIGVYLKYDWSNTMDMKEVETNESYKLNSYEYSVGMRFNLAN